MSRAIILGHTGFVGQRLAAELRGEGHEVVGHSSATLDLRQRDTLSVLDGVASPETTLFFSSAVTPDKAVTLDAIEANFAIAVNVAWYLETHPIRKCVYLSSDAVYPICEGPVTEETPVEPSSLYALAKYAGERVLLRIVETKGLALVVLRPTAVYGPGDTHGSYGPNLFVRTVVRERTVRLFGDGEETRDHVYIEDLARVAARLAASDATGVFNVATGESRAFSSIVKDLRDIVPHEFATQSMPRKGAITHRQFDVARLLRALPGFRFTEFRDGLRATYAAAAEGAA